VLKLMETTLILVKPDGVKRRKLVGEIIRRFEAKGLTIRAMKLMKMSGELADKHYAEHVSKGWYHELKDFMTGGPLVAIAVGGPDAVNLARKMMGATKPADSAPGTIRGDYRQRGRHREPRARQRLARKRRQARTGPLVPPRPSTPPEAQVIVQFPHRARC
jgi:nucleoside-diphosphate kinase